MKMKANELMIGDWVKYGNEYFQVDGYHRITNTLFLKYNGHTAHYEDGCVVAEDSEPIPLTAEILENNGFEYNTYNRLMNGRYDVALTEVDGHFFIWDRIQLDYVHELQRVLRCCGLFDLADNFKVTSDGVTTHTSEQKITD